MLVVHDHSGRLVTVLRRLSNDSTVEVAFPPPEGNSFVDVRGMQVVAPIDQPFTDLAVHGDVLARVYHAASTRIPDFSIGLEQEAPDVAILDCSPAADLLRRRIAPRG